MTDRLRSNLTMSMVNTIACSLFVCGAYCVRAADNGPADVGLTEILVTAQKRSADIRDVPLAITVATGEQLQKEGITEPSQLTKLVPSFTYQTSDYGTPVFGIRGVGFNDFSLGAGPTVTVYIDQVPLPFSSMTRGVFLDVEHVEVLKGPQGTLFGENSTGGAINVIAAKPTHEFAAGADVSYGRFDDLGIQGFLSGPLAEALAARFSAQTEHGDAWQESVTRPGNDTGKKDFSNARLLLDWDPAASSHWELNLSGWRDRSDTTAVQFQAFTPSAPPNPLNTATYAALQNLPSAPNDSRAADWDSGTRYRRDDDFYLGSLQGTISFAKDVSLASITAYSHYRADTPFDADGTAFPDLFIHKDGTLTSFFQELRLAGSADKIKWMLGANYQRDSIDEVDTDIFYSTNVIVGPYYFPGGKFLDEEHVKTISGFASLDYQITRTVRAQLSGRYSNQKRSFDGCFADLGDGAGSAAVGLLSTIFSGTPTSVPPGSCLTLSSITFKPLPIVSSNLNQSSVPWRASIDWKPTSDHMLYASITKGFKAGSYSVPAAVLDTQLDPVTQESVLSYEMGFKSSFGEGRAQLSGAVFYYDYRDKQLDGHVLNPIFGPLQQLINIPKSKETGVELEFALRPVTGLKLSGGITYLDSVVQEDPVAPAEPRDPLGKLVSYVGESYPNTPKWLAVTDIEYSLPIGSVRGFLAGTATYRSDSNAAFGDLQQFRIDSYTLVDLRAGAESSNGKWRVQLFGHNVFDKYYWMGVSRNIDTVVRFPGMPATYGVMINYRY